MGYFSNGTEGDRYEAKFCARCVHGQDEEFGPYDCPVLALHLLYNYDQFKENEPSPTIKHILNQFIRKSKDGPWMDQCTMFCRDVKNNQTELSGISG